MIDPLAITLSFRKMPLGVVVVADNLKIFGVLVGMVSVLVVNFEKVLGAYSAIGTVGGVQKSVKVSRASLKPLVSTVPEIVASPGAVVVPVVPPRLSRSSFVLLPTHLALNNRSASLPQLGESFSRTCLGTILAGRIFGDVIAWPFKILSTLFADAVEHLASRPAFDLYGASAATSVGGASEMRVEKSEFLSTNRAIQLGCSARKFLDLAHRCI